MREIKFRVWIKHHDEMWDDVNPCAYRNDEESYALMQFTGLQDKNGKDIYESDLVMWFYEEEQKEFILGPVRWVDDCSLWAIDVGYALTHIEPEDLFVKDTPYEVIGNIYETPELLK